MKLNKGKRSKQAVALVTVICFAAVVSVLTAVIITGSATYLRMIRSQVDIETAFYAAEAGIERAAAYLAYGVDVPATFSGKIGDATYLVVLVKGSRPSDSPNTIGGQIKINPNNSPFNEFKVTLPDGKVITRNDLNEDFAGYTGNAIAVHIKPGGNGNQNGLIVNEQEFPLENSKTYDILSSVMSVSIYNDHTNEMGKAVGKWYIAIASTDAQIITSK